jgi:hypothetical protein
MYYDHLHGTLKGTNLQLSLIAREVERFVFFPTCTNRRLSLKKGQTIFFRHSKQTYFFWMIIYHFGEIIKLIKRTTLRDKLLGFDGSYVPFALLTSPYRDRLRLTRPTTNARTSTLPSPRGDRLRRGIKFANNCGHVYYRPRVGIDCDNGAY